MASSSRRSGGMVRNRSANKELSDAMAAAALVGDMSLEDLDEVTDQVIKQVDEFAAAKPKGNAMLALVDSAKKQSKR